MTHGGNLEGSIKQKFFMRAEVAHGAINRARREKSLAEVGEVEVEGEGIALRGIHVNGGGAGGKVFGGEVEPQSGADEEAAAVLRAGEIGLAGRREGPELPVFAGNLNVEIFPEVIGTRDEAGGRTGARTGRTNNISTVRIGELDLHHDSYEFGLIAMIECGLLGAVVGLPTGMLDEKGERSKESDGGDVRAGFGRRKGFCVFVEESSHGFVAALTEEIGFTDGLVGQGRVESEDERRQEQKSGKDYCRRASGVRHWTMPPIN